MIKKSLENTKWLEFDLLQEFPNLQHKVTLRSSVCNLIPVVAKQVHGSKVIKLPQDPPLVGDALITNMKNIPIAVRHADCQAAIIYDPIQHAAACVHSGWKGSVKNIYREAILEMQQHYNSNPSDLIMCIGPSLGPHKAEFIHHEIELPETFRKYQIKPNYFDFWEISKNQALDAGILSHHLEIAKICTFENDLDFFSYRRDKTKERHLSIVTLL